MSDGHGQDDPVTAIRRLCHAITAELRRVEDLNPGTVTVTNRMRASVDVLAWDCRQITEILRLGK